MDNTEDDAHYRILAKETAETVGVLSILIAVLLVFLAVGILGVTILHGKIVRLEERLDIIEMREDLWKR